MAKRERAAIKEKPVPYFVGTKPGLKFVSSGCTLLDCALSGGYVLGRVVNIVGDKSTAKTALAAEAVINFLLAYPDGAARYNEVEAAFDQEYAAAMGMPVERVDFGDPDDPCLTVEQFEADFTLFLDNCIKKGVPGIYVLDSLDSLSDEDELERKPGVGTYGTAKAKAMSTMFRKLTRKVELSKVLLVVISQVRDNIGAMFGEKHKRSGGRALDFYASQIMYLANLGPLEKTIGGIKRPIGISIKAHIKKNKVGLPLRKVTFDFMFGYGVDDLSASLDCLKEYKRLDEIGLREANIKDYLKNTDALDQQEYEKECQRLAVAVKKVWREVETTFLPKRAKYG